MDGALSLDGGHGGVHVLGDDVTAVHEAAGHVLPVAGVALGHHVGRLEDRVGDLGHGQLLVVGLLGGDDGRVGCQHKVDAGVRYQVGLELGHIHIQGTVETQGSSQGGDHLSERREWRRVFCVFDLKEERGEGGSVIVTWAIKRLRLV